MLRMMDYDAREAKRARPEPVASTSFSVEEWLREVLGDIEGMIDVVAAFRAREYNTVFVIRGLGEEDLRDIEVAMEDQAILTMDMHVEMCTMRSSFATHKLVCYTGEV